MTLHRKISRSAHSLCNLQYKKGIFIPVMVDKISRCDGHLMLPNTAKNSTESNFLFVGKNSEKPIFSVGKTL